MAAQVTEAQTAARAAALLDPTVLVRSLRSAGFSSYRLLDNTEALVPLLLFQEEYGPLDDDMHVLAYGVFSKLAYVHDGNVVASLLVAGFGHLEALFHDFLGYRPSDPLLYLPDAYRLDR